MARTSKRISKSFESEQLLVDAPVPFAGSRPRAVVVLGMHRSGTSALTRVLNFLGADLPRNLMLGGEDNPTGHWESNDLFVVHDEILSSAGSSWDDWRKFNPDWIKSPVVPPFKKRLLQILRSDFSSSRLFVVKDPRICRLWPLWDDILREFGASPSAIIPIRNPLEVAASLKKRNNFFSAKCYLLWLRHVLDAEFSTRGIPRAITSYSALIEDWNTVISQASKQLDLYWPRQSQRVVSEIERFLSASERHQKVAPETIARNSEVADWVRNTYAIVSGMIENSERADDLQQLDRIRSEFDQASAAFGSMIADDQVELEKKNEVIREISAQIEAIKRQGETEGELSSRTATEYRVRLEELQIALSERDGRVQQLEMQLVQLEELRNAVSERDSRVQQLEMQLVQLEELRNAVSERDSRVRQLEAQLTQFEELRIAVSERDSHLQRLETEIGELRRVASERDSYLQQLETQIEEMRDATAAGHADLERMCEERNMSRRNVSALRAELQERQKEFEAAEARNKKTEREIESLRAFLRESQDQVQSLAGERDIANSDAQRLREIAKTIEGESARRSQIFQDEIAESRESYRVLEQKHCELVSDLASVNARLVAVNGEFEQQVTQLSQEREEWRRKFTELLKSSDDSISNLSADYERRLALKSHELSAQSQQLEQLEKHLGAERQAKSKASETIRHMSVQVLDLEAALSKTEREKNLSLMKKILLFLERRRLSKDLIEAGLFDPVWYLREYPDVQTANADPIGHYLNEGYLLGYQPNPIFDSRWYLRRYDDVRKSGINPLVHYALYGWKEGRDPSPIFNSRYYLDSNTDVGSAGVNPLAHYLRFGRHEGRLAMPRKA